MQTLTEKQTRKKFIDPLLVAEGWRVALYDNTKELSDYNKCAIGEYPTSNGPADYALCVDGKTLGIIEAKKVALGPQNVLTQAERYSKGVSNSGFNFDGFKVPFLYSTNGTEIWYHDVRNPLNRSRKVSGFHTPEALVESLNFNFGETTTNFFSIPDNQYMRPYQC